MMSTEITRYDEVRSESLDEQRVVDALVDATQSLTYLRTMRDPRADIYETIVGLLRERINKMPET